jgi:hypothetical protein
MEILTLASATRSSYLAEGIEAFCPLGKVASGWVLKVQYICPPSYCEPVTAPTVKGTCHWNDRISTWPYAEKITEKLYAVPGVQAQSTGKEYPCELSTSEASGEPLKESISRAGLAALEA